MSGSRHVDTIYILSFLFFWFCMMTVIMTAEVYGLFFLLDLASTLCLEHLASFNISAGLSAKGFLEANLDAFRMKP